MACKCGHGHTRVFLRISRNFYERILTEHVRATASESLCFHIVNKLFLINIMIV